jgi:hypothetical protein
MDDKNFALAAVDLTDREIQATLKVVEAVRLKYAGLPNTADNLEALRDEVLTRLMDINVLATLDPAPCFYGEPPELEIIGKIKGDPIEKYGFDHEQKQYEVLKSKERGEDFLGQKENIDKRKVKE